MPGSCPPVRPLDQIPGGIGAEAPGARFDSHPTQIQPVGIPACLQCGIAFHETVGVPLACPVEQGEAGIVQMDEAAAQGFCKPRPAQSVAIVAVFADPPGIVEEGEQRHHLGIGTIGLRNPEAVLQHPGPVDDTVASGCGQWVAAEDSLQNGGMVVHGVCGGLGQSRSLFRSFFKESPTPGAVGGAPVTGSTSIRRMRRNSSSLRLKTSGTIASSSVSQDGGMLR